MPTPPTNSDQEVVQPLIPLSDIPQEPRDAQDKPALTKEELEQIKDSLDQTVQAMESSPSHIGRATKYWGSLPLWQKISVVLTLILPPLVLAFLTQISILMTLSAFTMIIVSSISYLLENNYRNSVDNTKNLKNGVRKSGWILW